MDKKEAILLVEDNIAILEANKRALGKAGYEIYTAETLDEARSALWETPPDAIVLDILLPDGDGLEFIREIRALTTAPVLLLTCLTEKDERLRGLRAGGDDYITKPYDVDELRERVTAFLRRDAMLREAVPPVIALGPLELNITARRAYLNGRDMNLRHKEFDLLYLLVRNKGRQISAKSLYETVWVMPYADSGNAVWAQISRLKKKLAESGGAIRISSVRGGGYRLDAGLDYVLETKTER